VAACGIHDPRHAYRGRLEMIREEKKLERRLGQKQSTERGRAMLDYSRAPDLAASSDSVHLWARTVACGHRSRTTHDRIREPHPRENCGRSAAKANSDDRHVEIETRERNSRRLKSSQTRDVEEMDVISRTCAQLFGQRTKKREDEGERRPSSTDPGRESALDRHGAGPRACAIDRVDETPVYLSSMKATR